MSDALLHEYAKRGWDVRPVVLLGAEGPVVPDRGDWPQGPQFRQTLIPPEGHPRIDGYGETPDEARADAVRKAPPLNAL
jgi:hypothetical protein